MPRQSRLDAAGTLHHVIIRGIEPRKIFLDNTDRDDFLHRCGAIFPEARDLMITGDSGGSNGYRRRLSKTRLQEFADASGLTVHVNRLPPGTSKWNKIEHRLFSFISQNCCGKPLISHEVIVNLIASTRTAKGLNVHCQLVRSTRKE